MLKQISILSAIAITVAAVAPGAEAGSMKKTWKRWGNPPAPTVVTPAPRNVTQTNVVNTSNEQYNTGVGSTGCNKCGAAAANGITAGNQSNGVDISQTAGNGTVKQSNEVNTGNVQYNTQVGNGTIKAGTQSNGVTIKQSAP